jgi:fucose permease
VARGAVDQDAPRAHVGAPIGPTANAPPATAPAGEPEPGFTRTPWRLGASSALTVSAMSVVGATAPHLRVHLGVGTGALALAFVAQMLGAIGGSWLVGALRGRSFQLSPAAVVAGVALVAAMAAGSLPALVAAMFAAGVAAFVVNATSQAETMRRAGPARATALSQFHVWGGAGGAVFPIAVAGLLAVDVPWQVAFALLAAAYLAYAVVNRRLRVAAPAASEAQRRPRLGARARWAVTVAVLGGGLQVTFPLYFATLLVDRYGAREAAGTACIAVYAVGMLAARAGGTRAMRRVPAGRQLWLSGALLLAGYAVLAAAETTSLAFAAALLLGAGVGQLLPLGMARAAREIGDDRYATGVVFSLNAAMQVATPAAVAVMLQATSLRTALLLTFPVALVICAAVRGSAHPASAD